MTTNKEIRNRLLAIHTNFHEDENEPTMVNEIQMDSFGSFLTYNHKLPDNETIRDDYEHELSEELGKGESKFLPNNLFDSYHYDFTFNKNFFGTEGNNEFNNDYMFVAMNVAARPGKFSVSNWNNFHDQEGIKRDQNMLKMNLELNNDRFKGCYATDAIKKVVDSDSSNVSNDFFVSSDAKFSFANNSKDMDDDQRALEYIRLDEQAAERSKKYAKEHGTVDKYVRRFANEAEAKRAVKENRIIFYKSANVFVEEWKAVQPKQIVTFGGTSTGLLKKMEETEVFKQFPELCEKVNNCKQITHYSYRLNLKDFYNKYADSLN